MEFDSAERRDVQSNASVHVLEPFCCNFQISGDGDRCTMWVWSTRERLGLFVKWWIQVGYGLDGTLDRGPVIDEVLEPLFSRLQSS